MRAGEGGGRQGGGGLLGWLQRAESSQSERLISAAERTVPHLTLASIHPRSTRAWGHTTPQRCCLLLPLWGGVIGSLS